MIPGRMLGIMRLSLLGLFLIALPFSFAAAKTPGETMGEDLWHEALTANAAHSSHVKNDAYMIVIDYRRPSGEPRFFLVDMADDSAKAFLVAHGRGSDPDHDGMADAFSNAEGSKMSSVGTFVTAETYYGQHGLSLRLDGLDSVNDAARERAIVIHGADYVTPARSVMGRSWGCPALEQSVAQEVIPKIAGGVLIYTRGPSLPDPSYVALDKPAG